jgi:uncharacterized protein YjbI with pentapeptide repeats
MPSDYNQPLDPLSYTRASNARSPGETMSEQQSRPSIGIAASASAAEWQAQGMPWRTEPEIVTDRQRELHALRTQSAAGAYPFKSVALRRADVEWLLATHDDGRGPVDWSDPAQRSREGLDVRGADLSGADLRGLPLARMRGGLGATRWRTALPGELEAAAVHLEAAILDGAHLEGAILPGALLRAAGLSGAYLECAVLGEAHLEAAALNRADLRGAILDAAHLKSAVLTDAHAEQASLVAADLEEAALDGVRFDGAVLRLARLVSADLSGASLAGADLTTANLAGASLQGARLDASTNLRLVTLADREHGPVSVADVAWNGAKLSVFAWPRQYLLGDDLEARHRAFPDGRKKTRQRRLDDAEAALRAYRQVAAVLRTQGLDDVADQFAYRAWIAKHRQLARQGPRKLPNYLATVIVGAFTGYGYRPWRSVAWYLLLILGFTAAYLLTAPFNAPALRWDQALTLSVSSFHGRGFFTPDVTLTDTYARIGAVESVVGFVVELGFIATLTQRFFDK